MIETLILGIGLLILISVLAACGARGGVGDAFGYLLNRRDIKGVWEEIPILPHDDIGDTILPNRKNHRRIKNV